MALSIKNPEVERLARELAATTGESITDAVMVALRDRIDRETRRRDGQRLRRMMRIAEDIARLPNLDTRSADEIIGYDEHGVPS